MEFYYYCGLANKHMLWNSLFWVIHIQINIYVFMILRGKKKKTFSRFCKEFNPDHNYYSEL